MTKDAEVLYLYIKDVTKGNADRPIILQTGDIKGITAPELKIERLLRELKNQNLIKSFSLKEDGETEVCLNVPAPLNTVDGNNDDIHTMVMEKFIKKRFQSAEMNPEILESYSQLFRHFICVKNDDSEVEKVTDYFRFIAEKIDESASENFINVMGPDGTGKSSFLSILYLFLYSRYMDGLLKNYPFYINLHYYDRNVIKGKNLDDLNHIVEKEIQDDLQNLIELSKKDPDKSFLIIIDGNDKYDRTHLKSSLILEKLLNDIKGHKKIICLGEKTYVHQYRERNNNDCIERVTNYTFYFTPIYINEQDKWKEVIEQFCEIYKCKKQIKSICDCINKFRVKEIDLNLLTIFYAVSKNLELKRISSISDLYSKYCLEYLGKNAERLTISIEMAYKYFMTKEFIEQEYIAMNWREWELVHQHKTISNYLLALYYSRLIFEGKEENIKAFECVYTNGINIFLKSILTETVENQRKTLTFCSIMVKHGDYRVRAQAAYLAGRIQNDNLQVSAKEILEGQLTVCQNKKKFAKLIEKKQTYFVKRSTLVSLLYLGDTSAGELLLKFLFEDPVMNEVNRAFYLQYYCDVTNLAPEEVNFKDDGKGGISYTASVLFNYINNQLDLGESNWTDKVRYDFQIYLFTLCSLVQKRLEVSKQCAETELLNTLLSRILVSQNVSIDDNMRIYLEMLQEDIQRGTYGIGHLYDELYAVKNIQRRGWSEKIVKGSIQIDRYENVIEHTYYCWLLGMLYLPESAPQEKSYKGYQKKKILTCLLIHDLAEKYVGDILPEENNVTIRKTEKEHMLRIFMHDMYSGIGNMDAYRNAWENFELESKDINGKIAKEIDIIQSIYQFCIYIKSGAKFPKHKENEWKREKDKIKTSLGRKILTQVVLNKFPDVFA